VIVSAVRPEDVETIWPQVKEYLKKALLTSSNKMSVEDVYAKTQNGTYGLWVILDEQTTDILACYTTRIIQYPNRRALAIDWLGGHRMKEWIGLMHETVSEFAKDHGCFYIEGYGRQAWGRVLEKYGWKPSYICYEVML
tara:strand:- start:496 stop:912 length:417 start_codon:yes stop_codon:yes gene_type:complete